MVDAKTESMGNVKTAGALSMQNHQENIPAGILNGINKRIDDIERQLLSTAVEMGGHIFKSRLDLKS